MRTLNTYCLLLTDDVVDDLIKSNTIQGNLDTIFMISDNIELLENVKRYIESIPRNSDIIKSLTLQISIENEYTELFKIKHLTENTKPLLYQMLYNAINNVPRDMIHAEGILNTYNNVENVKSKHNLYYDENELNDLRNIFGHNII